MKPTTYNPKIVIAYFRACGVPLPLVEYPFNKPESRHRFDFAWPFSSPTPLALEINGAIHGIGKPCPVCHRRQTGGHTSGTGARRDMDKMNFAAAKGYRVIYCEPRELMTQKTVDLIKRCLGIG